MGKKIMLTIIILQGEIVDKELYKKSLDSISWADEVVKVNTKKLPGSFSEWRNEGIKKATGDWVLYVDSDEVVTAELRVEIQKEMSKNSFSAYAIARQNYIFGKLFKHSGQYPDYQKRLFKKDKFISWSGELHEESKYSGNLGYLKTPLMHYKNITISQMLEKTNKWSEIEGQLLYDSGHPQMNILRFASAAFREFWLRMVMQMAFLDGREGVIYAMYQVYSRLITYSKLWEKQLS